MLFFVKRELSEIYNATIKAPYDVYKILEGMGYNPINIRWNPKKKINFFIRLVYLKNKINRLAKKNPNSWFVFEYPYGNRSNIYLRKKLKFNRFNSILIIHDIPSLRKLCNEKKADVYEEIKNLNSFDYIIAHNNFMIKWLKENGVKSNIISLDIFDYLYDGLPINRDKNEIVFAGNLQKSTFLYKINPSKYSLNLFGNNFVPSAKNVQYFGSFHPDKLISNMKGGYGLVWDGDSLDECSGPVGNYLKYNNPHKMSLYIAAGLPIIIWEKAALSDFVIKNNIGICVDSLNDLDTIISNVSDEQYARMVENLAVVREKLINGRFLEQALKKIKTEI